MEMIIFFLVVSTLPQLVEPQVTSVAPYRAVAELISSASSRIFSGEEVRLRCSVPNTHNSNWRYLWFKGSEALQHRKQNLVLWRTRIHDSGKYYCQGVRKTVVGEVHTLQSLPVEIFVDGGWALIRLNPQPALVGHTLEVTCVVRGKKPLSEVILYRDGVEIMRNLGNNSRFLLSNLTIEDHGLYSCRASWIVKRQTQSVISIETLGRVVEILSKPILEVDLQNNQITKRMKVICHHQYNHPAPAPQVHIYFYKNNSQLGTATSENQLWVNRTPGLYRCKVRVPALNLVRWSDFTGFGQVPGTQVLVPSVAHPRVSTSDPAPLPTPPPAQPSPQQSTMSPVLVYPSDTPTQRSIEVVEASTLSSTAWSLNQTVAPGTDDSSEMSGDMSGQSGDMSGESGDFGDDDDSPL